MKIEPTETQIIGHWIFEGTKVVADEACSRISWLKTQHLKHVATDSSGWFNLYQDPEDERYWELAYPNSEEHGGGPPALIWLSTEEAKSKFGL